MFTRQLGSSLELIGGVRVEHSEVEVASLSSAQEPSLANPRYTDLLPSLAATWRLNERTNLRVSASQTLSRPEYRELSPITYREVLGQDNIRGNANLTRALIQNYDVRWEFYPTRAEVLSVAGFVKEFSNPVERIYQGTSDQHVVTFVNAKGAHNYGLELEARKSMAFLGESLRNLTVFSNLTLMKSRISLDPTSGSLTHADRKMVGQAPYVVNAGMTWAHPTSEASATLLFNRVGERISDAGEIPLPDVIEQPRNVLDASLLLPLFSTLKVRVDGKNLLDAPYRRTQGAVVREAYRAGRIVSVGFSWSQ
jgi:TonB-dependent receptor